MKFSSFKLAVAALGMVSAMALTSPASANDMIGNRATGFLGGTLNQKATKGTTRAEVGSVVLEGTTTDNMTPRNNTAFGRIDHYISQTAEGEGSETTLKVGAVSGIGAVKQLEDNTANGRVTDGAVTQKATDGAKATAEIGSVAATNSSYVSKNHAVGIIDGGSIRQEIDGASNEGNIKIGSVSGSGAKLKDNEVTGVLSGSISQKTKGGKDMFMSVEVGSVSGTGAELSKNTADGSVGSDVNQEVSGDGSVADIRVGSVNGFLSTMDNNQAKGELDGSMSQKVQNGAEAATEVGNIAALPRIGAGLFRVHMSPAHVTGNKARGIVDGNLFQDISGAGSEGLVSVGSVFGFGDTMKDNKSLGIVKGDLAQVVKNGGLAKTHVGSVRNVK